MESSAGQYQELYLLVNTWEMDRPLSEASLVKVEGSQVLTTVDYFPGNGSYCADSYWVLSSSGPQLIDFSAVDKEIAKLTPPDTSVRQNRCWALSMEKFEVSAPIQRYDTPCTRSNLGSAVVHFKLDGHRAVPVSSFVVPYKPEQQNSISIPRQP